MEKKEKLLVLASIVLIILQVNLEVEIPEQIKVMSRLLQEQGSGSRALIISGVEMLFFAFSALAVSIAVGYIIARFGSILETRLRDAAFSKVMDYSLEEVSDIGSGSLISRCTSDVTLVGQFINQSYQHAVKAPFTVAVVLIKLIGADYRWILADVGAAMLISLLLYSVFSKILPKVPIL